MSYANFSEKEILIIILQRLDSIGSTLKKEINIAEKFENVLLKLDILKDYNEILKQILSTIQE